MTLRHLVFIFILVFSVVTGITHSHAYKNIFEDAAADIHYQLIMNVGRTDETQEQRDLRLDAPAFYRPAQPDFEIASIESMSRSSDVSPRPKPYEYQVEADDITVEVVLVPHKKKVISSLRDGKITKIYVENGDRFIKGDLLLEYDCRDLIAEAKIAQEQEKLSALKSEKSDRLFKLEIISNIDRLGLETESKQAQERSNLLDIKIDTCRVVAPYDGQVTNRLANDGEFTRTDRVLLEIASREPLQAEFLIPSKWLRWVNIGAPMDIVINETGHRYDAKVKRIYGEVDPISQSIQMVALLSPYTEPLLPGMSGVATLNANEIRNAGIRGYLEKD